VPDSEDYDLEDESPNARRIRYDEEVARSLQNELDREVEGFLFDDDAEEQSMPESADSEDYATNDPKGKGKAVATRKASGTRAAAKKRVVQDSDVVVDDDDDDDDDEYSDLADLAPPAKKQKTATRGRGKQAVAKGKQVAAPFASDSDSDLTCKSQETTPAFCPDMHTYAHTLGIIPTPKDLSCACTIWSNWVTSSTSPQIPLMSNLTIS
jgi:hypothetical protein